MKTLLIIIALLISGNILFAQQSKLTVSGNIEFEKTVNMYAVFKKAGISEKVYEDYKNTHQQLLVLKSTLLFNTNKTLFIPQITGNANEMINSVTPFPFASQINLIYTDLSTNSSTNQKNFFEETLLVKDSIRKIKWKLTDEFRDVAGFACRRANAIILDSIYVVAFYTNQIHISGGPESFAGLPGMILEVALPHDNVIWRAIRVTDGVIPADRIIPPKKGSILNNKQLNDKVKASMKNLDYKLKNLLVKDLLI